MSIFLFITFALVVTAQTAEAALIVILGVVGTYITQFLKKYANGGGNKSLAITVAVCVALSFVATFWSGNWNPNDIVQSLLGIFSLATVAYRLLLSTDRII